ncbi:ABC transporter B family member 21-like isoform X2 [Tasmannia lanceolata]|uniref:ABC transporter B family member 21-like isoform X2 n=1 Tax=Tasmannia lanceolata TaxID=3420 RepID=UPI004062DEF9
MAEENELDGDVKIHQAASMRKSFGVDNDRNPKKTHDRQDFGKTKGEEKGKNSVPFYKLFSFADSTDVAFMIVGTVAALANGASWPLMTVFLGELVNSFGEATNLNEVVDEVSKVCLKFVYLAVGAGVASFFLVSCWVITGERQAARIRSLYLKTILRQDIAFFDTETSTGEVVGRMSSDTLIIQNAMGEKVASFTGEKRAIDKYKKSLRAAYKSGVQEGLAAGSGLGLVMFVSFCCYGFGIWFGSKMILHRGYSGGDVVNVVVAAMTGAMNLGSASPCISAFAAGRAAAFKMFETIERKPVIDASATNGRKIGDVRGDIELRDVYFSYPARPNEQIFTAFSLSITSGTTAALVGESGSGKSTVISLIERFYDPQAGEVLIDGINLKEFQLRWIRGKIGLVSQEPVLFSSSLKDNIAYGKDNATLEEIRAAAELSNADKFIDKMPQGLHTMIGEHGTQLSGGQKQRIAIARGILKDPRILLLDEATSALDTESESIVQEALERIMINRTTVIVAHRLSTVRNADMIAVIHRGTLVEKGSHLELIKDPNGAYSQLIHLQEVNNDSEQTITDQDKLEIMLHSGVKLRKRLSFQRSVSLGSSYSVRNSSPHAFSGPLSELLSFQRSVSGGSSFGVIKSGPHTFSGPFSVSNGLGIQEIVSPETDASLQQSKEVPLRRLAYLNKQEAPVLLLGTIAAIISGLVQPIFGLLISIVIPNFFDPPKNLEKDSRFWSLMFVVLALVSLVACPAQSYFFSIAGCRLIKRIRSMCFEKVVHMEIEWFDDSANSSGAINSRLSADAATVRSLVGDTLALLVQDTASLVSGMAIALEACWQLSLIVLAMLPLIGLCGWAEMRFLKGFGADAKMLYEEASQVANDAVGNIRTVASFCAEEKVMELYKKKCEGPLKTGIRQGLTSGIFFGLSFFLLFCVYATSFYAGARLIEDGKATFMKAFRVFFVLTMAAFAVSHSISLAPDATKAKSSTASIFSILDRKSKIDSSDDSGMILEDVKGNIKFQHVSFKYATRPDVQIFRELCLDVQSGKAVALVGESGSGKSTVISLLQRFYDPDSGQIMLDKIDIRKLQLRWLRRQMGLVSQEPVLFNDTIRANIAYGKEGDVSEAEILAAAKSANAHIFISGLQQGYDTLVGERGVQLSGGQKQRVAIARAIVKEPKILLLDEATSALDAESERVVQEALDQVTVNRTTIVVAHRLSTIKGADLIAVIKNGVIIEKGKHATLINIKDGAYASLVAFHMSGTASV